MLNKYDRRIVETVRRSNNIKIEVYDKQGNRLAIVENGKRDITKLLHDIAIALQDFYSKNQPNTKYGIRMD